MFGVFFVAAGFGATINGVQRTNWGHVFNISYLIGSVWVNLFEGANKTTCISCHSVVPFALARPALRKFASVSQPTEYEQKILDQTRKRVAHWKELDSPQFHLFYDFDERKKKESWGTEAVLNALILAFDDQYQGRKTSSDSTKQAFVNLWQVQNAYHAAAQSHRDLLRERAQGGPGPAAPAEAGGVAEFWRLGERLHFNLDSLRAPARVPG